MGSVKRDLSILFFLLCSVAVFHLLDTHKDIHSHATFVLGTLILTGYLTGKIFLILRLPAITGYLFTGLFMGPYFFKEFFSISGVISLRDVQTLGLINNMALGLIAFTAGGELSIGHLGKKIVDYLKIAFWQLVIIFIGVTVTVCGITYYFGLFNLTFNQMIVFGLMAGTTSTAISPATTVAVIRECKASGEVSSTVLGVTIIKDVFVIILFAITLSLSTTLLVPGGGFDYRFFILLLWELFGSLFLGVLFGWLINKYIDNCNKELPIIILTVGFLSVEAGYVFHLSGLLICLVAGCWVENYSAHGKKLILAIEQYSIPVYIIFFAISGASIDLTAMKSVWPIALVFVISRLLLTIFSTKAGFWFVQGSEKLKKYTWTGCLGQAGVTLGFAGVISNKLPEVGILLYTIIIATVGMNQVIGPIIFRYGLIKSGEAANYS